MRTAAAALLCIAALPAFADEPPLRFITTAELAARAVGPAARWSFTIVDARTRVEYSEGHIAGAVNAPASDISALLPRLVRNKTRQLIFYCNGPKCTKSQKAARAAMAIGYLDVLEYNEGLPAWGKARLPIDGTPLPAFEAPALAADELAALRTGGGVILVDVRDTPEFDAFHIPGSMSAPLDQLAARAKGMRKDRSIVIVDHAGHQTAIAARVLHSVGRSDLKRLDGGVVAWQQKGLPTESATLVQH